MVKVEVDFSAWEVLTQPKCAAEIEVRSMPVIPKKEEVSSQHQKLLTHPDKQSSFSSLFYSKDGKRLIAGGYPEGTVVVYDVASGSRLTEIQTEKSLRGSGHYAHVTPDEKMLLVTSERSIKLESFEKDQQPMRRLIVEKSIRRWNLETGELLWNDTRPNRGRPFCFKLTPNGKQYVIEEDPPGEFSRGIRPNSVSWVGDAASGMLRPLPEHVSAFGAFTSDSKFFVTIQRDGLRFIQAIKLIQMSTSNCIRTWPVEKLSYINIWEMVDDKQVIYEESNFTSAVESIPFKSQIKLLDITTSKPGVVILTDTKDCSNYVLNHDKTRLLYLKKQGHQYALKQVQLSDGKEVLSTAMPGEEKKFYGIVKTLSPDGKLLALAQWCEIPKELLTLDEIKPEQIGQPRIILVEVATGKVKATLVSPSAFLAGIAFSPDGKQLASSGSGCIHLWDISGLK